MLMISVCKLLMCTSSLRLGTPTHYMTLHLYVEDGECKVSQEEAPLKPEGSMSSSESAGSP